LENWALQRRAKGVFQTLFFKHNLTTDSHGQPQKEAPSPDEQAQAQKALEIQSPQEAHLAEVSFCSVRLISATTFPGPKI